MDQGTWLTKKRTLASGPDDKGVLETTTPSGYEEGPYTFHTSLPLPGTARGPLTYQWPYFSIVESKDGSELEWRVYPVEKGGLCYMLVDKALLSPKAKSKDLPPDEAIQAIYHHIGYGEALPDTHSEGILVLPKERADDDQDVLTTMSLLGALRYSREYSHTETGKMTSHEKFQKLMSRVKGDK